MDQGASGAAWRAPEQIVTMKAVGQVAAWLERVTRPGSGRATPMRAVVGAIAWHLRPRLDKLRRLRRRGVAGAAAKLPTLAHRVWLVPALAGSGPVRRLAGPRGRAAPPGSGPQGRTALGRDRHPIGEVHPGARPTRLRCRQEGAGAQARGPGGRGRDLARRGGRARQRCRTGTAWRRSRPARRAGPACAKPCWTEPSPPSVPRVVNRHGMRHRVVERDPDQKGFVVLAGR